MNNFINTLVLLSDSDVVPDDSMIVFSMLILTLTFMILGLFTKYKVFLMLSVGGFITLLLEFREHTPIVIAIIGVIIINLYTATIGSRDL